MNPVAVLGWVARQRRRGIFDLAGFEVSPTALVALVAAGVLAAVRTGPLDVPVREGLFFDRVERDLDLLLVDVSALDESPDDPGRHRRVGLVVGVAVVVELDVELRERLRVALVVREGELLGRDARLLGVDRDGRPVHVGARDEGGLLAEFPEGARVDVPSDVRPQVTDVQVAVSVRQPTRHHRRTVRGKVLVAHVLGMKRVGV
jgi:hypothetical protein